MTPIFTQNDIQGPFWVKIVVIFCEFPQFSKQSLARLKSRHFLSFLVRDKSSRIERIHFAESSFSLLGCESYIANRKRLNLWTPVSYWHSKENACLPLRQIQASVVERQKKKFCYPHSTLKKEDTLIILLSAWDRSRDSTANRNLLKDM